jgi:SAM-dependent methyltransferase
VNKQSELIQNSIVTGERNIKLTPNIESIEKNINENHIGNIHNYLKVEEPEYIIIYGDERLLCTNDDLNSVHKLDLNKEYINNQKNNCLENLLLTTPFGQELLHNEEQFYQNVTSNMFGYYAIQMGLPQINFLQTNRIPNKYLIPLQINCDIRMLPFATNSIDLIICPHLLEFVPNYETLLREFYRVLIPKGKLIISNFNRSSFLGLSNLPHAFTNLFTKRPKMTIPDMFDATNINNTSPSTKITQNINWIGLKDIKKSLVKLNFVLNGGKFFSYLPPINNFKTLSKLSWLNKVGDRWLPTYANSYAIIASKELVTFTNIKPQTQRKPIKTSATELSGA